MESTLPSPNWENTFFPSLVAGLTPTNIALYAVLAALLPLFYTFAVSSLNDGKPTKDGEPPMPPYWVPFAGHAFAMMRRQDKLLEGYRKEDGKPGKPRTLTVFGQRIYLVSDPASISQVYRKSKTMTFDPMLSYTFREIFGGTKTAEEVLNVGLIGVDQTGLGSLDWCKIVHGLYLRELNPGTPGLESMTRVFIRELGRELERNVPAGSDFVSVDIFAWIKRTMFPASGRALYGTRLRITDEFANQFWNWDKGFLKLAKKYPDFMIPGVRASRKAVLDEFARWRMEVKEERDNITDDVTWEENFGSRLVRDRVKLTEPVLAEDDHMGHASIHLSLFWGLEANAIPVASWVAAFALLTPGLMEKLRAEVVTCLEAPADGSSGLWPSFDVDRLCKLPFLTALWLEAQRLGISSISPRIVVEDTEIDGYVYKKGGMVQALAAVVHVEEEYWGKNANRFDPGRWMPSPGEDAAVAARRLRDQHARLRPFGGGVALCPGRHFAAREILATMAVLITGLEWDIGGAEVPEPNRAFFAGGGLPPMNDVRVRVRRSSAW